MRDQREWREKNKERLRAYKREWTRARRAAGLDTWYNRQLKGKRVPIEGKPYEPPYIETKSGNEQYRFLCRLEYNWLKGAPLCEICGTKHPPHKHDSKLVSLKDFWDLNVKKNWKGRKILEAYQTVLEPHE